METLMIVAALVGIGLLVLWARAAWLERPRSERLDHVGVDEHGVRIVWADGRLDTVHWAELVAVDILTTSDGPFAEDLYWVLRTADGSGCMVPSEHAGPLLERLGRLPRFDHLAVVVACGSTSDAHFEIWKGAAGEASTLGA